MKEPLVSIIMGAYNSEKTIEKCINSIMTQTYSNWEFIICNDCSTDMTKDILQKYSQKDKRITILNNEKNMRLAASLNACLKVVHGKYVARMDADDLSLPERIRKQVEFLENHTEVDCVGCSMIVFDENGDIGVWKMIEHPTKEILLTQTPFAHPTIMMKSSVYKELGGYTISEKTMRSEDLDLWFRFYNQKYVGYNIQEPLYKYHESIMDLKKRTLKAAVDTSLVYLKGYRTLGFPVKDYIFACKPIISSLIPYQIMHGYRRKKWNS